MRAFARHIAFNHRARKILALSRDWKKDAKHLVAAPFYRGEVPLLGLLSAAQKNITFVGSAEDILAGASVHFDRRFLKKNMPLLEAFFYHRMFDISALKTAAQMWNPSILPPAPKGHRALADVRAAIALAKVFKPIFEFATVVS